MSNLGQSDSVVLSTGNVNRFLQVQALNSSRRMSVYRKYIQSQLYMLQKHICFNKCKLKRLISLPVLSPSPSCPQSFLPQPNTPPDTERAKLCSPPAETWTRGSADRDRRCWGELVPSFLFPWPSWPLESWPHVYTWPSVGNHHDFVSCIGQITTL